MLQPGSSSYRVFRSEVRLAEHDVPEPHVDRGGHLEPYQKIEACCAWLARSQEEAESLVGSMYHCRGAEFGDAVSYEDFQVLRRR